MLTFAIPFSFGNKLEFLHVPLEGECQVEPGQGSLDCLLSAFSDVWIASLHIPIELRRFCIVVQIFLVVFEWVMEKEVLEDELVLLCCILRFLCFKFGGP